MDTSLLRIGNQDVRVRNLCARHVHARLYLVVCPPVGHSTSYPAGTLARKSWQALPFRFRQQTLSRSHTAARRRSARNASKSARSSARCDRRRGRDGRISCCASSWVPATASSVPQPPTRTPHRLRKECRANEQLEQQSGLSGVTVLTVAMAQFPERREPIPAQGRQKQSAFWTKHTQVSATVPYSLGAFNAVLHHLAIHARIPTLQLGTLCSKTGGRTYSVHFWREKNS